MTSEQESRLIQCIVFTLIVVGRAVLPYWSTRTTVSIQFLNHYYLLFIVGISWVEVDGCLNYHGAAPLTPVRDV